MNNIVLTLTIPAGQTKMETVNAWQLIALPWGTMITWEECNMSGRRKKKNGWKTLAIVLTVILVLGAGIFFTKDYVVAKAEEKLQDALVENVLETVIQSDSEVASDAAKQAKEIYDSMDEEDKQACRDLIDHNLTTENIKNVAGYVKNGDASGLKSYVKSSVSEEDKETVKELYYKYKDQISFE